MHSALWSPQSSSRPETFQFTKVASYRARGLCKWFCSYYGNCNVIKISHVDRYLIVWFRVFVAYYVLIIIFSFLFFLPIKSENHSVSPYRFPFIRSGSLVRRSTATNYSTANKQVSTKNHRC